MTTCAKLERLRQNDPRMTDLDLWLSGDSDMYGLIGVLQRNSVVQSASLLYTCQSSWLQETTTKKPTKDAKDQFLIKSGNETNHQMLMALLETLGTIPSLRKVTITGPTSRVFAFPIEGLTSLLRSGIHMTKFSVGRMIVTGVAPDYENFTACLMQHPCLEDIYLNGSVLLGGELGIQGAQEQLMHAISSLPTLKSVTLNGTGVATLSTPALFELSLDSLWLLCQSKSLARLWIYDFPITDDHLQLIHHALAFRPNLHSSLREIRLSSCTIGNWGLRAIANLVTGKLGNDNSLKVFHIWLKDLEGIDASTTQTLLNLASSLQRSSLRDFRLLTGAENQERMAQNPFLSNKLIQAAFLQMLHFNYSLETFVMIGDTEHLQADASFYLKLNQLGRRKLFGRRNGELGRCSYMRKEAWVDFLAQEHCDLSCLFYLVSMNPSLCQKG